MAARDGYGKTIDVQEAIRYVITGQGEPMEVYLAELL
jgi:hypothetical protein